MVSPLFYFVYCRSCQYKPLLLPHRLLDITHKVSNNFSALLLFYSIAWSAAPFFLHSLGCSSFKICWILLQGRQQLLCSTLSLLQRLLLNMLFDIIIKVDNNFSTPFLLNRLLLFYMLLYFTNLRYKQHHIYSTLSILHWLLLF